MKIRKIAVKTVTVILHSIPETDRLIAAKIEDLIVTKPSSRGDDLSGTSFKYPIRDFVWFAIWISPQQITQEFKSTGKRP